jgi:hypothetical protein
MPPIAYHLTWTTYGTWLPGDSRGWVQSGSSQRRLAPLVDAVVPKVIHDEENLRNALEYVLEKQGD